MSIEALPTSKYISDYSIKAVQDFLRPQSTLDRIYLITLMIWFISSIIFSQEPMYRVLFFVLMIIILTLNNLEKKVMRKNLTLVGSAIKLFIMYLLISFFTGNKPVDIPFSLSEDLTYLDIENIIIIGVFIFAIILNSLQFYLIKYYGIKGYQAFIRSLVRGLWIIGITIFILISSDLLVEEIAKKLLWEEFLFSSFMLYLISSLLPLLLIL